MSELLIDTLNLHLPKGFEKRAATIARETSRQLSKLPITHSVQQATLNIPRLQLQRNETNTVIAQRIAQSIYAQIATPPRSHQAAKESRHD